MRRSIKCRFLFVFVCMVFSCKLVADSGGTFESGNIYAMRLFGYNDSINAEYSLPMKKVTYGGHDFEARAFVVCRYDSIEKLYRQIGLHIFLKPADVYGFNGKLKKAITEYGNHNTVVIHNLFHTKGNKQEISGEADVYARAFSPGACTAGDMAKLSYVATLDMNEPAKSSIDYKLSAAVWSNPDMVIESQAKGDGEKRPCVARWDFRLHNADYGLFAANSKESATNADWKKSVMGVSLCCLGRDFKEKNEFPQTLHLVNADSPDGSPLYEKYRKPSDTNAGKLQMQVVCVVEGYENGKKMSPPIAENAMVWVQGSGNDGEITLQTTLPGLNRNLPFVDKHKDTSLDLRVKAKCVVDNFRDETLQLPRIVIERASFSCMIHN